MGLFLTDGVSSWLQYRLFSVAQWLPVTSGIFRHPLVSCCQKILVLFLCRSKDGNCKMSERKNMSVFGMKNDGSNRPFRKIVTI